MNYRIKISFNEDKERVITATAYKDGESVDITSTYTGDEKLADFTERLRSELQEAFANRVVIEKVSIPNPVAKETLTDDSAKLAQVDLYEKMGKYKKVIFEGKSGSGRSTRAGQYAEKNQLKIVKVFNFEDKEIWFFKG